MELKINHKGDNMANTEFSVNGIDVRYKRINKDDYISLTDLARYVNPDEPKIPIQTWMRNKDVVSYLGLWEQLNNPNFKGREFTTFENKSGANSFYLSPEKWVNETNAIGIIVKRGNGGGTYAHRDIAFEFASWLSPEFKLYLVTEHIVSYMCDINAITVSEENNNQAGRIRALKNKGLSFIGDYYNKEELKILLERVKGTPLEYPVYMAVYYGLRRSEVSGLQWSAVDFQYRTITIRRTIVGCYVDGKYTCIEKERTKTKQSLRTLPLMPVIEEMLIRMKKEQEKNRKFFGNSYVDSKYIYVHEDGKFYNPNYITCGFNKFLRKNNLRHIRFHELRHSCATLMRHEGVKMEDIQKWLGHSQLATTEKIYSHFEEEQHIASANVISKTLTL